MRRKIGIIGAGQIAFTELYAAFPIPDDVIVIDNDPSHALQMPEPVRVHTHVEPRPKLISVAYKENAMPTSRAQRRALERKNKKNRK